MTTEFINNFCTRSYLSHNSYTKVIYPTILAPEVIYPTILAPEVIYPHNSCSRSHLSHNSCSISHLSHNSCSRSYLSHNSCSRSHLSHNSCSISHLSHNSCSRSYLSHNSCSRSHLSHNSCSRSHISHNSCKPIPQFLPIHLTNPHWGLVKSSHKSSQWFIQLNTQVCQSAFSAQRTPLASAHMYTAAGENIRLIKLSIGKQKALRGI